MNTLKASGSRLQQLLSSTCMGDPGAGGAGAPTDGDGGGGTSTSPPPAPASSESSSGFGGASAENADHRFPTRSEPTDHEIGEVRGILAKEKDPNHSLGMSEIAKLLNFDMPFKPAEPKKEATVDPKTPQAPPAPPAPPAPTEPQKVEPSADAKAIIEAIKAQTQPAPAAPAEPTKTEPAAPKPYYGDVTQGSRKPAMQVHPEVAKALFDADPEKAAGALNYMVNGIMNHIMQDISSDMVQFGQFIMAQVPKVAQQTHAAATGAERFYSKFPELNREPLHRVTQLLDQALAADCQKKGKPIGDEQYFADLGAAVHMYVKQKLGVEIPRGAANGQTVFANASPPSPPAAPPSNGQAAQPWMTPGGSRPPAGPGGPQSKSAELLNLVL